MATVTKAANAQAAVGTGWTSPTNAYADDGTVAAFSGANGVTWTTDYGFANFSISDIPDGSTINSVTVYANVWVSQGSRGSCGMYARNNGANVGTEATTTSTSTSNVINKAYSTIPTLADLRSASTLLKARVRCTRTSSSAFTGSLDYVYITVDFTAPPPIEGSLTANAVIKYPNLPGSFSINAVIKKTGVVPASQPTANAVIKKDVASYFLTEALIADTGTKVRSFTADAVILRTTLGALPRTVATTKGISGVLYGTTTTQQKNAQSFTAAGSVLTNVGYVLYRSGSPTDSTLVELWTSSAGKPSGTVVATLETILGSTLPSTFGTASWRYVDVNIELTEGQLYWLVLSRTGSLDDTNLYVVVRSTDSYSGGGTSYYNGTTWGSVNPADMAFSVSVWGDGYFADAVIQSTMPKAGASFTANATIAARHFHSDAVVKAAIETTGWSFAPLGDSSQNDFFRPRYLNGLYIAATGSHIWSSEDPRGGWVAHDGPPHFPTSIAYGNGYWVVATLGYGCYYSTSLDGPWTALSATGLSVEYDSTSGLFFVLSYASYYHTASDPSGVWTEGYQEAPDGDVSDGFFVRWVNGVLVSGGDLSDARMYPAIAYASTATGPWTRVILSEDTGHILHGIEYGNGYWVAMAGHDYYVSTSLDGPWTHHVWPNTEETNNVAYIDGVWVAGRAQTNNMYMGYRYTADPTQDPWTLSSYFISSAGDASRGYAYTVGEANGYVIAASASYGSLDNRFFVARSPRGKSPFSASAVIKKAGIEPSVQPKADAVISSRGFTADAVVAAGTTTFTFTDKKADAVIRRTQTGSFAANAVLKKIDQLGTTTANAAIKKTITPTGWTADALVKSLSSSTFAAAAVIKASQLKITTADAIRLRTMVFASSGLTTLAQDSFTEAGSGTADLSTHTAEVGGAWGTCLNLGSGTFMANFIDKDLDKWASDENGSGTVAANFLAATYNYVDVYLTAGYNDNGDTTTSYTSVLARRNGTSKGDTNAYSFDICDCADNSTTYWRLSRVTAGTYTVISSGTAATVGSDIRMHLRVPLGNSPTSLRARYWKAGDAEPDTWVVDTTENTAGNQMLSGTVGMSQRGLNFNVLTPIYHDDFLVTSGSGGSSDGPPLYADAFVVATRTGSFTVAALLRKEFSGTFTAAALLRTSFSASFTANAVLKRSQTGSGAANAILKRTQTGSGTANAVIKGPQLKTTTADAIRLRTMVFASSGPTTLAQDSFTEPGSTNQTLVTHTAEVGGTWAVLAAFSGNLNLWQPGDDWWAVSGSPLYQLGSGVLGDGDVYVTCRSNTGPQMGVWARLVGTNNVYLGSVDNGSEDSSPTIVTGADIRRITAGAITVLASVYPHLDDQVRIRLQVSGSSPTSLKMRVWHVGDAEPGTWDISTSDNTAGNQAASGGFGIHGAQSGYWGSSYGDDFLVTSGGGGATPDGPPLYADAFVVATRTGSFAVAAVLKKTFTGTLDAASLVRRSQSGTFPASAVVKASASASFVASAVVKSTVTPVGPKADAVVKGTVTPAGWTIAALIRRSQSSSFAANALVRAPQTSTFSSSALLKRAQSGAFAAAAIIKAAQSSTFTVNAVLKRTQAGSGTANAVIRGTVTPTGWATFALLLRGQGSTLTVAALVKSLPSSTFVASVILKRAQAGTFSASAIIKGPVAGAGFTVAALLRAPSSSTLIVAALLRRTQTPTGPKVDAWLQVNRTGTFSASAVIKATMPASFGVAAAIFGATTFAFGINSIIKRGQVSTFPANALLLRQWPASFSASAWFVIYRTGSFAANAVLKSSAAGSFALNSTLKGTIAPNFAINVVLKRTQTNSFAASAILIRGLSSTFTANAWLQQTKAGSFYANSVLKAPQASSFALSAITKRTSAGSFSSAAIVRATSSAASFTLAAILLRSAPASFSASAWLQRTVLSPFTVDAILRVTTSNSFSSYALIRRGQAGSFVAASLLRAPASSTFAVAAVLRGSWSSTFSVAALVRKTTSGSFVVSAILKATVLNDDFLIDAVIKRGQAGSFVAGAVLLKSASSSFPAAALLRLVAASTFAANAVLKTTQTTSTKVDAVLFRPAAGSLTVNAVLKAPRAATLTADAVLKRTWAPTPFVASALLLRAQGGAPKADAVIRGPQAGSKTADATLRAPFASSLAIDAVLRVARTGTFSAGAWKAGVFSVSALLGPRFSVDAFIQTATSGAFIATAVVKRLGMTSAGTADAVTKRLGQPGAFTSAALVMRGQVGSFASSALVKATASGTKTVDAVIKGTRTSSGTADALLLRTRAGSMAAEACVLVFRTTAFAADADLRRTQSASFAVVAVVARAASGTFAASADVKVVWAGEFRLDAVLRRSYATTLTADAIVLRSAAGSLSANATLLSPAASVFGVDARVIAPHEVAAEFTLDAISLAERASTFDAHAIVIASQAGAFNLSAWIYGSGIGAFPADAIVKRTSSATIAADAILGGEGAGAFSVAAAKKTVQQAGFGADAAFRATRTDGFATSAVFLSPISSSATVDATLVVGGGTGAFGLSALIQVPFTTTFATDAVFKRTSVGAFTAGAAISVSPVSSLTVDAIISSSAGLAFDLDAILLRAGTSSFGADASISLHIVQEIEATFSAATIAGRLSAQTIEATNSAATYASTMRAATIGFTWFFTRRNFLRMDAFMAGAIKLDAVIGG